MPGIEVFTISGAPIWISGAGPTLSPDGGAYLPDEPDPAPTTALVKASPARIPSASPPVLLQNAIRALGVTTGNTRLMVDVDGVIGPKTVTAVNLALSTYVGSTPQFPRADLNVTRVQQYAGSLATIISERVRKSGGVVPPPVVKSPSRGGAVPAKRLRVFDITAASMVPQAKFEAPKWLWWVVGGAGLLVVLSAAASAARKRREARTAP